MTKDKLTEATLDEADFEGTLVLEKLAAIGKADEFFDAIDSDNIQGAVRLMKQAKIDRETIDLVVQKIQEQY